jgi:hypothetical protein
MTRKKKIIGIMNKYSKPSLGEELLREKNTLTKEEITDKKNNK